MNFAMHCTVCNPCICCMLNFIFQLFFHFSFASFLASGTNWFFIPPNTCLVASDMNIMGLTTVPGIFFNTPPTAPVTPYS